jgi:predicted small lipoprotein YifL
MLKLRQILSRGLWLAAVPVLSACGQKGGLYLPTEPAARGRATLPQTVFPGLRKSPAAGAAPAAAPAGAPAAAPADLPGATESPSTTVTPSTPARPVSPP